jgi:general secretion pathway protein L
LPLWSLARPDWRQASLTSPWRGAAIWTGEAALLWVLGLHIYAVQLRNEARTLRNTTEQAVLTAFPSISIVIDPVQQARGQRDAMRLAGGTAGEDDFLPLALAAAKVLDFAAGHVASLHYDKGKLSLVLAEGYIPPANEAVLHQAAAVQSLTVTKDEKAAHTWHFQRSALRPSAEARP